MKTYITLLSNLGRNPKPQSYLGIRPWGVELSEELDEVDQTLGHGAAIDPKP